MRKTDPAKEPLNAAFERLRRTDSYGFLRSRRGTYVNPAVARDWRWFVLGMAHAEQQKQKE